MSRVLQSGIRFRVCLQRRSSRRLTKYSPLSRVEKASPSSGATTLGRGDGFG